MSLASGNSQLLDVYVYIMGLFKLKRAQFTFCGCTPLDLLHKYSEESMNKRHKELYQKIEK